VLLHRTVIRLHRMSVRNNRTIPPFEVGPQTVAPAIASHDLAHLRHASAHCFIIALPFASLSHDSAHSLQMSTHSLQMWAACVEPRAMKQDATPQISAQSRMMP